MAGRFCSPVKWKRSLFEEGVAKGMVLSERALYPKEEFYARKAIISNLTAQPTFLKLVGEEHLPPYIVQKIKMFRYDENILFGTHFALRKAPEWRTRAFDQGIQKAFMGYLGMESMKEVRNLLPVLSAGEYIIRSPLICLSPPWQIRPKPRRDIIPLLLGLMPPLTLESKEVLMLGMR